MLQTLKILVEELGVQLQMLFFYEFVNEVPWAHIDIAGTAWTQDGTIEKSYNPKGATGFGIRTIIKLLESNTL